jgi:hypothetical protein
VKTPGHVLIAIFLAALAAATHSEGATAAAPNEWLAFVAQTGGAMPPWRRVIDLTPLLIVYGDGRAVWRDTSRPLDERVRDPEIWRTGRIAPGALKAFATAANGSPFFTARLSPPGGLQPRPPVLDSSITHVGIRLPGMARVARVGSLGSIEKGPLAGPFVRSVAEMRDAVLALRPRESARYEPEVIRVGFYPDPGSGEEFDWPLKETPELTGGAHAVYRGERARAVIRALARGTRVRAGGRTSHADWAPAIEIPDDATSGDRRSPLGPQP